MSSGILQDKIAIVFGAGGSIGSATAKEFALEGAQLFLAGRTQSHVEDVTRQIAARGGRAEAATVDALDVSTSISTVSSAELDASTRCSMRQDPLPASTATENAQWT
jgi:NADP-dependent 3-hydroxy acid dehydrogenase YdfG